MAGNEIKFTLAGDATSLERAFDRAGAGAKDMAGDFETADKAAGRFSGGVGSLNDKIGDSESKFMGAADLVDGLAGAFGISLGPTVEYARAFGDMAGGFNATLGPAMEKITGKLGKLTWVTRIQAAAQGALNAVMRANPLFMVIGLLTLLTAGFVLAYKKSETFRNIVNGAMDGVKKAIGWVGDKMAWLGDKIRDIASRAAGPFKTLANAISTPYRLAFNAIAWAWNNTVGRLSVSIPGFMGFGGISFDVPDIPTVPALAKGGTAHGGRMHLVGEQGPELFVPRSTGTVLPNGFGADVTISFDRGAGDALMSFLRAEVRKRGGIERAFA
jgi:phage-related minor tail protein